jgi:hypothetical protein
MSKKSKTSFIFSFFNPKSLAKLLKSVREANVKELLLSRINNEIKSIGQLNTVSQEISYGYL